MVHREPDLEYEAVLVSPAKYSSCSGADSSSEDMTVSPCSTCPRRDLFQVRSRTFSATDAEVSTTNNFNSDILWHLRSFHNAEGFLRLFCHCAETKMISFRSSCASDAINFRLTTPSHCFFVAVNPHVASKYRQWEIPRLYSITRSPCTTIRKPLWQRMRNCSAMLYVWKLMRTFSTELSTVTEAKIYDYDGWQQTWDTWIFVLVRSGSPTCDDNKW